MTINFIDSIEKMQADYKYMLHIMNYFSQYFTTYLSVTVNTSDVIQTLKNLFN